MILPVCAGAGQSRRSMMRSSLYLTFLACFLSVAGSVHAASSNKQRVRRFDWDIISSEHFDFHYYDNSHPLVPQALLYMEESYQRLCSFYRITPPDENIPFFLFAEHNEFEQTNIVDIGEGTGGVTEAFKNRLAVFNNGSQKWLENVITHEMTHVMEFYILYGGFWRSIRLLKSFFYPLWMMEGLAEYGTGEIDRTNREMYVRDAATTGGLFPLEHLHNFSHLKPHQVTLAYKESEMAIRYLADEYGIEKVKQLLPTFKYRFDPHSVLTDLIGLDLFSFSRKFIERLEEEYAYLSEGMKEPDVYGKRLTDPEDIPHFNTNPDFGPDEGEIIYLTDRKGYPEICVLDLDTGRSRTLVGDEHVRFENINRSGHAISLSPDGTRLAFAAEYRQKSYLFIYDRVRKKYKRYDLSLDLVSSPDFSPDGASVVLSGMRKSITDIYLFEPATGNLRNLTDDARDDRYPIFMPDGSAVIYSAEVRTDDPDFTYQRDIYRIRLDTGIKKPLITLPRDETQPAVSPDGSRIFFVNDQDDVPNLYVHDLSAGETKKLTHVIGGNFTPTISPYGDTMVFVSYRHNNMDLYLADADRMPALAELPAREEDFFRADLASGITEQFTVTVSTPADPKPYRFSSSTDLFFPILFYSSLDGLFAQMYWQASEMLGNHQVVSSVGYASGDDLLGYNFSYAYLKYKPQIFFGAAGENDYRDFDQTERRTRNQQFLGVGYPLNRFARIELQTATIARMSRFRDRGDLEIEDRENIAAASFTYDVTRGRYLEANSGYSFRATYEQSDRDVFNSDYDYRNHIFEGNVYVPLGEPTFVLRLLGGVSVGKTAGTFRLGGVDRLRGFARNADRYKASRVMLANAELRIPLSAVNYYVWFFFPDLFFKRMTGVIFSDSGYLWEEGSQLRDSSARDINNSVGLGLRFYTFILQTFRLDLSFDWARRTSDGKSIFYFSFGPKF